MYFTNKLKGACLLIGLAMSAVACKDDAPDDAAPDDNIVDNRKFGITVEVEAAGESYAYILPVDDLMKDETVSPIGYGIDITGKINPTYGILNGHNIFYPEATAIKKYSVESGSIKEIDNIVLNYPQSYSAYMAKTYFVDNTLNILSYASYYDPTTETRDSRVFIIDTTDMILKADNPLKIPIPSIKDPDNQNEYLDKSEVWATATSFAVRNSKIYLGYKVDHQTNTAYVLIADYPSLQNQQVASITNYGVVTGSWFQTRSSFFDEEGNFYFTTRRNEESYTLLRIKAGSTAIDPDYVFDLSNYDLYEEAYGGNQADQHAYIKDGKAFLGGYIFDIKNKTMVKNLNDSGLGRVQTLPGDGVYVEGNYAYLFIKTSNSKWYVARYDASNDEFKRGLQIDGGVSYGVGIVKY